MGKKRDHQKKERKSAMKEEKSPLRQINIRVWFLPAEEETDRPVLGYVWGDRWSLQIDAGASPAHVEKFRRALAQQGLAAPSLAVLTHWHWDHTFGMNALGCPALACQKTQEALERVSRWAWTEEAMARRLETGEEIPFCDQHIRREYPDLQAIQVRPADMVFEKSLTLDLGGITAQVLELPATHSPDSVIVVLPELRFAFLGDAVCGDFYGLDGAYDPERLRRMIDALEELPFDRCITGHGSPEDKASLLRELREEAGLAVGKA